MKYRGIIFDLDGVICHTDKYHYLAWKEIADQLGIYFDEEINNRLRGVSRMDSFEIILERYTGPSLTREEKIKFTELKNEKYKQLLLQMSSADLSEEVKNTLDILRSNNIKMAIGSSSKNARTILSRLGLHDFFDGISDGNNITKSKPDPEVFIIASELINVSPLECLVVEDAEAGIKAAIAANMDSAAIGDGTKCGLATFNLTRFSDLLDI